MKKYIVSVLVTKIERWEVEAENAINAADDYSNGKVIGCSDEECEIYSTKEA